MWAALDAEFYLALHAGHQGCAGLLDELKCNLTLLPTAYQEIADNCVYTEDSEIRTISLQALIFMGVHGVLAAPIPGVNIGLDLECAHCLIEKGFLVEEEKNQALLIGEATCLGVDYFLTLDSTFSKINQAALDECLTDRSLKPFKIMIL